MSFPSARRSSCWYRRSETVIVGINLMLHLSIHKHMHIRFWINNFLPGTPPRAKQGSNQGSHITRLLYSIWRFEGAHRTMQLSTYHMVTARWNYPQLPCVGAMPGQFPDPRVPVQTPVQWHWIVIMVLGCEFTQCYTPQGILSKYEKMSASTRQQPVSYQAIKYPVTAVGAST
jgi:hypothetical protein